MTTNGDVIVMKKKTSTYLPASFDATHVDFRSGQLEEHDTRGDIEIDYEGDEVEIAVHFDEIDGSGGFRQAVTLRVNPKAAREIAYLLLLKANDLE